MEFQGLSPSYAEWSNTPACWYSLATTTTTLTFHNTSDIQRELYAPCISYHTWSTIFVILELLQGTSVVVDVGSSNTSPCPTNRGGAAYVNLRPTNTPYVIDMTVPWITEPGACDVNLQCVVFTPKIAEISMVRLTISETSDVPVYTTQATTTSAPLPTTGTSSSAITTQSNPASGLRIKFV